MLQVKCVWKVGSEETWETPGSVQPARASNELEASHD